MNRPFAIYPDSFDGNTLGYWRFGEAGGRLAGPIGPTLAAGGSPTSLEDGYRFDGGGEYLGGAFAGEPSRAALTMEMWIRGWATAAGTLGAAAEYRKVSPLILLRALRHATPASSYILGQYYDGTLYSAQWTGAAADAILVGLAPWHVAVVMANGSPLRLFVNGGLVASSGANVAIDASAGDYTLRVGQRTDGSNPAACIIDEARLSGAARYGGAFSIARSGEGRRAVARGPGLDGLFAGVAA